jgi:hypothetical protein
VGKCNICGWDANESVRYSVLNGKDEVEEDLCGVCAGIVETLASVEDFERLETDDSAD